MEKMVAVSKRIEPNPQILSLIQVKQDVIVFPVRIGSKMANIKVFVEYEEESGKKESVNVFITPNNGIIQGTWCRDFMDDKVSLAVRDVIEDLFDEEKSSYRNEVIRRISSAVVLYCRNKKIIGVR